MDAWWTTGRFALFLACLVFAAFPGVLLGTATFNIRDYGMFSYPVAYFQREAFWRGELPLWNPYNSCGVPFLAQWNTMCLYPPALIYLLLPLTWSLSFFCLAHLFWGGLGAYWLAHRWTNHRVAAAVAGIVFAFNGLSLNCLMWPSHIATLSWFPWVVWLGQRAWREGGATIAWAALAASLQMLAGGPETILLTWILLGCLAVGDCVRREVPWARMALRFMTLGFLVGLVCAAQLLPFLELLSRSRDSGYSQTTHNWTMPLWGWLNFLVPLFRTSPTPQGLYMQNGQYWTSSYYAGIGTLLLTFVALRRSRDWRLWLMTAAAFVALVLAWGDSSIFYNLLREIFPGLGFVRYPVKFVILPLALLPLMAALGVGSLTRGAVRAGKFEFAVGAVLLCGVAGTVWLDRNGNLSPEDWRALCQNAAARAGMFVLVVALLIGFIRATGKRRLLLSAGLLVACWFDLVTHVPQQNPVVAAAAYTPGWARAENQAQWPVAPRLGTCRVRVAPAAQAVMSRQSLPDLRENYLRNRLAARVDCNLLDEVPQVDGFFSLTPRENSRIARLLNEQPEGDLGPLLDFLGVGTMTAPGTLCQWAGRPGAMPLATAGQAPAFTDDAGAFAAFSATNVDFRQTVCLPRDASGKVAAARQADAKVALSEITNQKVVLETEASAVHLVVLSQTWFPEWHAYVDGTETRIWRANCAFQAVEVPAGRHRVELRYEDRKLVAGFGLSGLGLVACLSLMAIPARMRSGGNACPNR
jgi:hypothetical protein